MNYELYYKKSYVKKPNGQPMKRMIFGCPKCGGEFQKDYDFER